MFTAMAVMFGAQMLQGIMQGDKKNQQIAAQNKARVAQSQQQLLQAGQDYGNANVQAGALASQATGDMAEAARLAALQSGSQSASAAAAGIRGASVDAVQNDIERNLAASQNATVENLAQQRFSLRERTLMAYKQASLNNQGAIKPISSNELMGSAATNAALNVGSMYAQQYFQFGSSSGNAATGGK